MPTKQTVGMGETEDEVVGNVAAQVALMVAELQPGQTLVVERRANLAEMFRVRRHTTPEGS